MKTRMPAENVIVLRQHIHLLHKHWKFRAWKAFRVRKAFRFIVDKAPELEYTITANRFCLQCSDARDIIGCMPE